MRKTFVALTIMVAITTSLFAQQDLEGAKDSPMFPNRITNYFISESTKNFDAVDFNLAAGGAKLISKEGTKNKIRYDFYSESGQSKPSILQILRNYEAAAKKIGGETVFLSAGEAIGVYNLSESFAAFVEAGIHVFKGKAVYGGDAGSILHIPVIAGARFKVNGFFVGAGAGFGSWSSSGTALSGFLYSPQIGYDLGNMQLLIHYTSGSVTGGTFSYAGLKFFRTF